MKIFAFYLPQFHAIPENNQWWGDGFTEWVNVQNAKPLYKGHIQPKHPLNNNYYNLLDKKTVCWQNDLLKKYKIDGLIYYHYYFNGKLLLEKPAENLLNWKDIQQPFFFLWANHSWTKSWKGEREILMPMEYGSQRDWEKHFQYLFPFFCDERYQKIDNRPLLMLYKTDFSEKQEMVSYFNTRCKESGFNGLCVIETKFGADLDSFRKAACKETEYIYIQEPHNQKIYYDRSHSLFHERVIRTIRRELNARNIIEYPFIYNGNKLMKNKIANEESKKGIIHGLWFEWDNTPRHKGRGYVITPYTKELFMKYMDKISSEEFLFVNAWNEWCEGMMLEPTVEDGYKYLEWIKEWKGKNG